MRPDILNPLFAEVEVLKGIGPALAKPLHRLALNRVVDILFHLPVSWIERKRVEALDEADVGRTITVALTARDYRQSGGAGPVPDLRRGRRRQLRHAHLFQQSGLGEEAAPARRAADRLGPARPLRPGIADGPSRTMCCSPARPRRSPSASRSIRSPKGSPTTASPISPARRWRGARRSPNGSSRACKAQQAWPDWAEALDTAIATPPRRKARERLAYDEVFANQLALMLVRASSRRAQGRAAEGRRPPARQARSCPTRRPAPSAAPSPRSRATSSRTCRCCACSRAMSARARRWSR